MESEKWNSHKMKQWIHSWHCECGNYFHYIGIEYYDSHGTTYTTTTTTEVNKEKNSLVLKVVKKN